MGIRKVKPTSAGRRFQTYATFEEITTDRPQKGLVEPLRKSGGRNNVGRVTAWQRGGGHKRRYRIIDFKRDKESISRPRWPLLNTTPTARPILPCCIIATVRSATFLPLSASRSAIRS